MNESFAAWFLFSPAAPHAYRCKSFTDFKKYRNASDVTGSADMKMNVNVNSRCLMTRGGRRQGRIAAHALGLHNTRAAPLPALPLRPHTSAPRGPARRRARPQLRGGAATRTERLRKGKKKSDHEEKLKSKNTWLFFLNFGHERGSRWRTLHFFILSLKNSALLMKEFVRRKFKRFHSFFLKRQTMTWTHLLEVKHYKTLPSQIHKCEITTIHSLSPRNEFNTRDWRKHVI